MYEIIKEVIEACDNNIAQLDYEEEGLHFLIRNVGKGKVVYLEKSYHDEPTKMKFEDFGIYKNGIFYYTDSYWLLKQKGNKFDREGTAEEAVAELNGKLKSYSEAYKEVEGCIKNTLREYVSGKDVPTHLEHLSDSIKKLGDEIAFDIALKGESSKIEYTINRFEINKYQFESIFFGLHEASINKIAEDYFYESERWHNMYNEYLAKIYADTLDYSTMDEVKMYKALSSADMKTVNATIEGNGCKETYKLNVEMLCYDIAFRRDLSFSTYTADNNRRECEQLMGCEQYNHVYPNQITKITYGKKVIYEKEEA